MQYRWLLTIVYGLFVIWTGLLRSIEAQTFKPNSFFFCFATGLIAIAAGYFLKSEWRWVGSILAIVAVVPILWFYLHCFITQPDKDATYRVGLVIIASLAQICVLTVPGRDRSPSKESDTRN